MRRYQGTRVFLFMVTKYQIFADEAWTHQHPPNRYHTFFGGIFGKESATDRLSTDLSKIRASSKFKNQEVKWSTLSPANIEYYKNLVDCIFHHILNGNIKYRQMFLDRAFQYNGPIESSELDVQYKLYYQFIKHSFGIQYLNGEDIEILIRLDGHSSQKHKDNLQKFVETEIPKKIHREDISLNVTYIDSRKHINLQVCDVLMGSAGYYGNKYYLRRENRQRGMTEKQKIKYSFAKYIYDKLRSIDANNRGSKAFNWFESTGLDGDFQNYLNHQMRIWKFIPKTYVINAGWHNDNLDSQGRFIAEEIRQPVHEP